MRSGLQLKYVQRNEMTHPASCSEGATVIAGKSRMRQLGGEAGLKEPRQKSMTINLIDRKLGQIQICANKALKSSKQAESRQSSWMSGATRRT